MENPLVSVIVTTYNRRNLLKETLDSIINQTYRNIEIIVVDNFSNYDFFDLISSFNNSRIIAFQNQNNNIIAVNRNFGIKKAKGKFIAFCDDDDLWLSHKLEEQLTIMEKYPFVGLCCTSAFFLHPNGTKQKYKSILFYLKHVLVSFNIIPAKYLLVAMNHIVNSSVIIRQEVIEEVGYITEDPQWRASEDFHYWLLLSEITNIFYLKKQSLLYRLHQNQISNNKEGKERFLKILSEVKLNRLQKILLFLRQTIV